MTATIPPKRTVAPDVEFQRLDDVKPAETVTALIYGGSKTGKTWFAGTTGERTLFINTGDGLDTVKSPLFKKLYPKFNPLVVDIREKLDVTGIPENGIPKAYALMCDAIDYALDTFADRFDTIVVDELSATRRHALFKGLELSQAMGRSRTLDRIKQLKIILPAGQDYGAEMSLIEQFLVGTISICERAKKHFLVLAHQRYLLEKPRDEKGNVIFGEPQFVKEVRPAVTGAQFPDTISALFDNVWHAEKAGGGDQGTAYRMRFYGDEKIMAGSRHAGVLPTLSVNPNFLEIIEAIRLGRPYEEYRKGIRAAVPAVPVAKP